VVFFFFLSLARYSHEEVRVSHEPSPFFLVYSLVASVGLSTTNAVALPPLFLSLWRRRESIVAQRISLPSFQASSPQIRYRAASTPLFSFSRGQGKRPTRSRRRLRLTSSFSPSREVHRGDRTVVAPFLGFCLFLLPPPRGMRAVRRRLRTKRRIGHSFLLSRFAALEA